MIRLSVTASRHAYEVVIAPDLHGLGEAIAPLARSGRVLLATDSTVDGLWGDACVDAIEAGGVSVVRLPPMPAGEVNKTRAAWWDLVDAALAAGVDRNTPWVVLGGGVPGDVAGFAAASVLRGVPLIQVPTTTLAMIDSSVGGKTGFNHPLGKNLVGAFHAPSLVWAPIATLATLPERDRRAGLAEAVKAGLVEDRALFDRLLMGAEAVRDGDPDALAAVVAQAVASKARVVSEDERERGRRAILNAGHTVGHAIETVAGYGVLRHGEAVGIGLVEELSASVRAGWTVDPGLPAQVAGLLDRLGLPVTRPPELAEDALRKAIRVDKKADGAMLVWPVVHEVGQCVTHRVPWANAEDLLFP